MLDRKLHLNINWRCEEMSVWKFERRTIQAEEKQVLSMWWYYAESRPYLLTSSFFLSFALNNQLRSLESKHLYHTLVPKDICQVGIVSDQIPPLPSPQFPDLGLCFPIHPMGGLIQTLQGLSWAMGRGVLCCLIWVWTVAPLQNSCEKVCLPLWLSQFLQNNPLWKGWNAQVQPDVSETRSLFLHHSDSQDSRQKPGKGFMQSQGALSEDPSGIMMIKAFWVLQKASRVFASPWVQKASLWT